MTICSLTLNWAFFAGFDFLLETVDLVSLLRGVGGVEEIPTYLDGMLDDEGLFVIGIIF